MTPPPGESFDDLPLKNLRRLVATLVAEMGRLREAESAKDDEIAIPKAKIVEQADEIARLKNLPKRPKFKGRPFGMEQATSKPKVEAEADTDAKRRR